MGGAPWWHSPVGPRISSRKLGSNTHGVCGANLGALGPEMQLAIPGCCSTLTCGQDRGLAVAVHMVAAKPLFACHLPLLGLILNMGAVVTGGPSTVSFTWVKHICKS